MNIPRDIVDIEINRKGSGGGGSAVPINYELSAARGVFNLHGLPVEFDYQRETSQLELSAEPGHFTIDELAASFLLYRQLEARSGIFSYTGFNSYLSARRPLTADAGIFSYTGYQSNLRARHLWGAYQGFYGITGYAAELPVMRAPRNAELINALSAAGASASTGPALAGDIVVWIGRNNSDTPPALPTNYNDLGTATISGRSLRAAWRELPADTAGHNAGTGSGAGRCWVFLWRHAQIYGVGAASALATAGSIVEHPTLPGLPDHTGVCGVHTRAGSTSLVPAGALAVGADAGDSGYQAVDPASPWTPAASTALTARNWCEIVVAVASSDLPAPPSEAEADVTATPATFATLVAATPNNLGGDYIIDLAPGTYPVYNFSSNWTRGTTRLRLRSQDRSEANRARMAPVNATGAQNVSFEHLTWSGSARDEFGYYTGSALTITRGTNIRVWGCHIERYAFGLIANQINGLTLGWTTIQSCAIDAVRLYAITAPAVQNVEIHNTFITHQDREPNHYPDLTLYGGHYSNGRQCSVDYRRSDQGPGATVDKYVMNLAGDMVLVTAGTQDGRHPDLIQGAGVWINVTIRDSKLVSGDIYCHGIYANNADDGGWANSENIRYTRLEIVTAHPHAMTWQGLWNNVVVDGCWLHHFSPRTWSAVTPGMAESDSRQAIGTRNTSSTVTVRDTVLPDPWSTYWTVESKINAVNFVKSNSVLPPNWASTDVASGRYGHAAAPAAP